VLKLKLWTFHDGCDELDEVFQDDMFQDGEEEFQEFSEEDELQFDGVEAFHELDDDEVELESEVVMFNGMVMLALRLRAETTAMVSKMAETFLNIVFALT